jgi:hypothetical protein
MMRASEGGRGSAVSRKGSGHAAAWLVSALVLAGCVAGPEVTRMGTVGNADEGPYGDILVVSLFDSFDMRRYLETELVSQLREAGFEAVASTSMMDSRTPVVAATFVDMVERTGADSVLLTQLIHLQSTGSEATMNPRATLNVRPTYYYNVFTVELTEYVEPPEIRFEHDLTLLGELISVRTREPVWAIQTRSKVVWKAEMERDYSAYVEEAEAVTRELLRDGVIGR